VVFPDTVPTMTTGRMLALAALRSPMAAIGWRPRASGWFTVALPPDRLGVAAAGFAVKQAVPGTGWLTLYVGLRDPRVEAVIADLCGVHDSYRDRTTVTSIGYISPEAEWHDWYVTQENVDEVAEEIARRVDAFAVPYLERLNRDADAVIQAARKAPSFAQATGRCRVAVLLTLHGGPGEGSAELDRYLAEIADQHTPFADSMSDMIAETKAWIASRN
jgi:hypothetical protein